eukprot:3323984-Lingulodinium_polyedra.AAC.1
MKEQQKLLKGAIKDRLNPSQRSLNYPCFGPLLLSENAREREQRFLPQDVLDTAQKLKKAAATPAPKAKAKSKA